MYARISASCARVSGSPRNGSNSSVAMRSLRRRPVQQPRYFSNYPPGFVIADPTRIYQAHQVLVEYVRLRHARPLAFFGFNAARHELGHEVHAMVPALMEFGWRATRGVEAALVFNSQEFWLSSRHRPHMLRPGEIVWYLEVFHLHRREAKFELTPYWSLGLL